MIWRVRRVLTGHDADGRSTFIADGLAPNVKEMASMPGLALTDLALAFLDAEELICVRMDLLADFAARQTAVCAQGTMPPILRALQLIKSRYGVAP